MAVNERTFSRILPESTGDRIGFLHTWDIEYKDKTGAFVVGKTIVDGTSGLQGIILKDTVDNGISTSGVVSVRLLPGFESASSTVDSDLNVDGSPQATTVAGYCVYIGRNSLVGFNNPTYGQSIDVEGQASVRFAEGSPQFDAFGKMQVSQATTIGEHIFEYDIHQAHFTDITTGSGTLVHQPDHSGLLLSCTTTSGDKIERISNRYYKYQAGKSQLIEITAACGDEGKVNVTREWGYGDDSDGVFFLLEDLVFNVELVSSVTGSVVTTKIPQASWNGDVLDGTGTSTNLSGHLLDLSKDNIYWIDLQWLGAGRVRFGVVIDGKRIVCHSIYNANSNNLPYMRTGSLPLHIHQENTGTAASTSEFRVWCMVVKTEGSYEPPLKYFSGNVTKTGVTTRVNVVTFRSTQTFKSKDNRVIAYGEDLEIYSSADLVLIELIRNPTIGGSPAFGAANADSTVEMDVSGTTVTGGTVIHSMLIKSGDLNEMDLGHIFNIDGEGMSRKAVITDTPDIYTIAATALTPTSTSITLIANWNEAQ